MVRDTLTSFIAGHLLMSTVTSTDGVGLARRFAGLGSSFSSGFWGGGWRVGIIIACRKNMLADAVRAVLALCRSDKADFLQIRPRLSQQQFG